MAPARRTYAVIIALALGSSCATHGQPTATQRLTMEVKPVARLVVSADPLPLVAEEGSASVPATDSRYSIVTNLTGMRITASIDRPMPSGTFLAVRFGSTKGVSRGDVDISHATAPAEVVAGIQPGIDRDQAITYTFSAAQGSSGAGSQSRVITLTLTE